jgi:hypothetical protein
MEEVPANSDLEEEVSDNEEGENSTPQVVLDCTVGDCLDPSKDWVNLQISFAEDENESGSARTPASEMSSIEDSEEENSGGHQSPSDETKELEDRTPELVSVSIEVLGTEDPDNLVNVNFGFPTHETAAEMAETPK